MTTRNCKRAKAGYHRWRWYPAFLFCGIKFALCELGRPPYMARLGVIAAYVRTGRACTPLARCNTLDFVPKSVCQGA